MRKSKNDIVHSYSYKYELLNLGYYKAPFNKPITPKMIPQNVEYLEIITNGYVFFTPEGFKNEIKFGCGTMFWHIPGDYTIWKADKHEPYECLCISFQVYRSDLTRRFPRISVWQNNDEALNFSDIILQAYHSNIMDKESISNYVYAKVSWEAKLSEKKFYLFSLPENLLKMRNFIKENFSQNIPIKKLSEIVGLSPAHLHVLTKKYFNKSPHELILDRRLSEARKLLLKTNKPIKEIAQTCGFSNIETFYRAFNRKFKITPAKMKSENDPRKLLLKPQTLSDI